MAFVPILPSQTDAESPIDVTLMDTGLRLNLDDHEARILALEGGGGGGGGGGSFADAIGSIGAIKSGLKTNEATFWKRRFSPTQSMLNLGNKGPTDTFDPDGIIHDERWIGPQANVPSGLAFISNSNAYRSQYVQISKNDKLSFKLKKGENFFTLGYFSQTTSSDSVTVTVDGVAVTNLQDEHGITRAATFSTNASVVLYGNTEWFYGLEESKEHIVTIENTDSASKVFNLEFVEVGFASPQTNYSLNTTVKYSAGEVNVRGSDASVDAGELTFTSSIGYGHTAALVSDTSGVITALDGVEPAMTQALPDVALSFSSGITSIKVKNSTFFPSSGFCLATTPWGHIHYFSYTSKTETTIGQHTLNGLVFQSAPDTDFTPLSNFGSATQGDTVNDYIINLWGTGGITVSASNNKLDFKVIDKGTESTHVATIANGLYSADVVRLGPAIVAAMETAKPLAGNYICEYDSQAHKWLIGIEGDETTELELLFSSGANQANSIHGDLGYNDTDLTTVGSDSFLAQTEVESLAVRSVMIDREFKDPTHNLFMYSSAPVDVNNSMVDDVENRLGIGYIRTSNDVDLMSSYHCPPDSVGGVFTFMNHRSMKTVTFTVDDGAPIYTGLINTLYQDSTNIRASLQHVVLTWPRGSKVIRFRTETEANFEVTADADQHFFVGMRDLYTKPAWESLTTSQSIIKTFDIAPLSLYRTFYAHDYSPQASFDTIDTITFTGSWTNNTNNVFFNGQSRNTATAGDTVDITLTTLASANDGAGFCALISFASGNAKEVEVFVTEGASASETNTLVQVVNCRWVTTLHNRRAIEIFGLKQAQQYTVRIKNTSGSNFDVIAFGTYETDFQDFSIANLNDVANTDQGLPHSYNVRTVPTIQDQEDHVLPTLFRSGYQEGIAGYYHRLQAPNFFNYFEAAKHRDYIVYYSSDNTFSNINDIVSFQNFWKSVYVRINNSTGSTTNFQTSVNNVNTSATSSSTVDVKGGTTQGSNLYEYDYPIDGKLMKEELSGTPGSSTVFPVADTRSFKVGQSVIVKDDVEVDVIRVISSIAAGASVTFTEGITNFANYGVASNSFIEGQGRHVIEVDNNVNALFFISGFSYEPMELLKSEYVERMTADVEFETRSIIFRDVANGDDLYYPTHSDGTLGNWLTSSISIIGRNTASQSFSIDRSLSDIVISSGTIDVRIVSRKKVKIRR